MKVDEIIKKRDELEKIKKEYDYSVHLKMKYMPYTRKCALVKGVIDNTSYAEIDGKKYYRRNTAGMLFVFTMQLIANYTDLEFEQQDVVKTYDALMESGVMNGLMNEIPEEEISILRGMLDMQRDDEEVNNHSLVSFFENKADALVMAMDSIKKVMEKPEIQAKLTELTK